MNTREITKMKEAYEKLYIIENILRLYIIKKMEESYGVNWFHLAPRIVLKRPPEKPLSKLLFHEYERLYLRTYSLVSEKYEKEFYQGLHKLYPIRNKVAHCHPLCENEMDLLNGFYCYISNIFSEKESLSCEHNISG
jgi:hypothetical protein